MVALSSSMTDRRRLTSATILCCFLIAMHTNACERDAFSHSFDGLGGHAIKFEEAGRKTMPAIERNVSESDAMPASDG